MAAIFKKFSRFCGSEALAWILLANAVVFVVVRVVIFAGNQNGLPGNFTMIYLALSSNLATAVSHPWTLLSYMVVHFDFFHLLFNMLWLFWFGRFLLTTLSDSHLLFLYFGGGIAGGILFLLSSFLPIGGSSFLVGASAAVLAVITACAFRSPDMRLYLFLFGEVRLKWVALACILLTIAGIGGGNAGGQAAHIGGILFGCIFALCLRKGKDLSRYFVRPKHSLGAKRSVRAVRRDSDAVARAVASRPSDTERLDQLLDKIRKSGYASLSPSERNELNMLSGRLQK